MLLGLKLRCRIWRDHNEVEWCDIISSTINEAVSQPSISTLTSSCWVMDCVKNDYCSVMKRRCKAKRIWWSAALLVCVEKQTPQHPNLSLRGTCNHTYRFMLPSSASSTFIIIQVIIYKPCIGPSFSSLLCFLSLHSVKVILFKTWSGTMTTTFVQQQAMPGIGWRTWAWYFITSMSSLIARVMRYAEGMNIWIYRRHSAGLNSIVDAWHHNQW